MKKLVVSIIISWSITVFVHAMPRAELIRDGEVTPAASQEFLDTVVAALGAKHYMTINNGHYRYPNEGVALELHSPHFALANDANANFPALRLDVGVDGRRAHFRVDEFFAGEGMMECRCVKDMVILAIWRDILGDEAFDLFISDVKDLNTFYDDILDKVKESNPDYDKWTQHRKVATAYEHFYANRDIWRSTGLRRLGYGLTLDLTFLSRLVRGFMGITEARGLLAKRAGKTVFAAPPGTFSYLANIPEFVTYHPFGEGGGMNGLVIDGQQFIGFTPGINSDVILDVDYYVNMHYECLFADESVPSSLTNSLSQLKLMMAPNERQNFRDSYFYVNYAPFPFCQWIWFHYEYLKDIYLRYVPGAGSLDERLKEIFEAINSQIADK